MRLGVLAACVSRMVANDVTCTHVREEAHVQVQGPVVIVEAVGSLGDDHDRSAHRQSTLQIDGCDRMARERQVVVQGVCQFDGAAWKSGLCERRRRFVQTLNLLGKTSRMKCEWLQPS